jgi:arsenite methyltransferase
MSLRDRFFAGVARQLGRPGGLAGRAVGRMLNRGNRRTVTEAVEALSVQPGAALADIGFGGGLGLELFLSRAGPTGHVHGIELSSEMLARAERHFRDEIATGTLVLHRASIERLPLADASLDGAITINTIYFLGDLERAFAQLARVLRPTGRVVVGLGDPESMARLPFTAHGFRLRPVDEVVATLDHVGLTVKDHRRLGEGPRAYHLLVAEPEVR